MQQEASKVSSPACHYIKIIVVCPCVSVMGGQQKQFDLEKQVAVSLTVER